VEIVAEYGARAWQTDTDGRTDGRRHIANVIIL